MPASSINVGLGKASVGRSTHRLFLECRQNSQDESNFSAIDEWLGDRPDESQISKMTSGVLASAPELTEWAESPSKAIRRVARLVLLGGLTGKSDEVLLQRGLTDPAPRIRGDAARLAPTGDDRTRLYNQLIRLIREDPNTHVRQAAGKRLTTSFADLYSLDFDGLPPLSRILILDALEGITRLEEERAEALLLSDDIEAAFRAARCLLHWGTLKRLFKAGGKEAATILEKAASLGVVDFIETLDNKDMRNKTALKLAALAGRDDILRQLSQVAIPINSPQKSTLKDLREIEECVMKLSKAETPIESLPLDDRDFQQGVETAFPPPDKDVLSVVLFEMARKGHWIHWSNRVIEALSSPDPDIRRAAAETLAVLNPELAVLSLPALLTDPVKRVRETVAKGLALIPAIEGGISLAAYLKDDHGDSHWPAAVQGLRDAGGDALARCIINSREELPPHIAGELLSEGINTAGAKRLAKGFNTVNSFKTIAKTAGAKLGESLVAAWPSIEEASRNRLSSWIKSSGWAASLPKALKAGGRTEYKRIRHLLRPLENEDRQRLLEDAVQAAQDREKRRLKRLMKP